MLVYNRYREKYGEPYSKGKAFALTGGLVDYDQGDIPTFARGMFDVVGYPHDSNVLYIGDVGYIFGYTSGQVSPFFSCESWAETAFFFNWDFVEPPGVPTDGEVATKLVAQTNPSRPGANLPLFVYELKDIPRMVKRVGEVIKKVQEFQAQGIKYSLKEGSSDFLAYQFGWSPLVKDLTRMFDFMANVDQRINELDRLYSEGGLHRKLTVFDGYGEMSPRGYYVGPVYGGEATIEVGFTTHYKKWGTVRYVPTTLPRFRGNDEKIAYARRLVAGFSVRPATLWEAMPWSWLIDWFGNVGDHIAANLNEVPVSIEHINIMTKLEIVPTNSKWTHNPWKADFKLQTKNPMRMLRIRTPTVLPTLPSFHLPFISGKQLSIMAALAIQRF